ncbi:AMP-binding protein [Porcipelethomonas sp.]|uniref:AMP-binding protein n=1 Tax=Porcipelethomonas sp. TaxID=2981675 RepID=UPI003EF2B86D
MDKSSVKTLLDLIKQSSNEYNDKIFLKEKNGKEINEKSFSCFYEDSLRVCAFLNGISNDGKLHAAVIGPTSYAYLVSYFGTVIGGNVIVPLDAQLACDDICELLNRSDSSVFFYDYRYEPMLPVIRASCPGVNTFISLQQTETCENSISSILENFSPEEIPPVSPESLAAIVYTSGTTGKSKGVMLSHGNLIDNTMCQDNESSPEDTLLTVLPVHHVYCFTCDILLSLRYGATVCVNDSMMRISQNLKLFQPTLILLVPMIAETIYKQIMAAANAKKDIPPAAIAKAVFGGRLKGIYSGGAYLSPELIKEYKAFGIPMAQGYGMTECSPRISTGTLDSESCGDVGAIVNGCEVKIQDGEIMVKSPSVMMGYYKDTEATSEALTEDGWLHTGDLGYVDEQRRIFITGRKKNLIILSNGENVSPEELENRFALVNMVSEVLVYAEDGVITAEIYPNNDICAEMNTEEIGKELNDEIQRINQTLPSSKTIRRLRIRDKEFEKTTSKKIIRRQSDKGVIV